MHFKTHTKPRASTVGGDAEPYHDAMIDHDKNVGSVLKALDDLASQTIVRHVRDDNGPHMNSWPDAAMTPFRNEKNSNWKAPTGCQPCSVGRGKIRPGQVSNDIICHLDMLPTLLRWPVTRRSLTNAQGA